MYFLGSEKRETRAQVEAHLVSEYTLRTDSGTVFFHHPVLTYVPQEVEILFHLQIS